MKLEVYKSKGLWRWRITARNGRILAVSSEGYSRKSHCSRMAQKCSTMGSKTSLVYITGRAR